MINVENEVFSTVATALRAEFSGIFVSGEYVSAPPSFPAVTLIEEDNSTYTRSLDSSGKENHAQIMYSANVYSNLVTGRKSQCKAILALIDEKMFNMGFLRVGSGAIAAPNADVSIYRLVARYRATVSKDEILYRR